MKWHEKTDTADGWFGLAHIAQKKGDTKHAQRNGRDGMPLFEQYRSQEEVDQVSAFIEGLEKSKSLYPRWLRKNESLK